MMYVWIECLPNGHITGTARGLCSSHEQALEYFGVTQEDVDINTGCYRKDGKLWWLQYVVH
jgi:hypothetical protein